MIVVVREPVLLSEVRPVRELVLVQLVARVRLAMANPAREKVRAKCMRVAVAKVVVTIPQQVYASRRVISRAATLPFPPRHRDNHGTLEVGELGSFAP